MLVKACWLSESMNCPNLHGQIPGLSDWLHEFPGSLRLGKDPGEGWPRSGLNDDVPFISSGGAE